MRTFMSRLAIATFVIGAALVWSAQGASAQQACGGSTRCSCGDVLRGGRILTGQDPIVHTVCTGGWALKVVDVTAPVTLDLGGRTIRCGSGGSATLGILIDANMVTVQNGTVEDCAAGVSTNGRRNNLIVRNIEASRNGTGFDIRGDVNRLILNSAEESLGNGISVEGVSNVVQDNSAEQNGSHGILVVGGSNFLNSNISSYNDGDGILVIGTATLLDNQARSNRGRGVFAREGFLTPPDKLNYGNGNRTAPNCQIGGRTIRLKYC